MPSKLWDYSRPFVDSVKSTLIDDAPPDVPEVVEKRGLGLGGAFALAALVVAILGLIAAVRL